MNDQTSQQPFIQNQPFIANQQFILAPHEQYDNYHLPQHVITTDGGYIEVNQLDSAQSSQTIYIQSEDGQSTAQFVDSNVIQVQPFNGSNGMGENVFNEYMEHAVDLNDGSGICYVTLTEEQFQQQQMNQAQPIYQFNHGQIEHGVQYVQNAGIQPMGIGMQQVQLQSVPVNVQQMVDPNMQQMPVEYVMEQEYQQPFQVVEFHQPDNVNTVGSLEEVYAENEVDYIVPEDLERAGFTVDDFDNLTEEQFNVVLELKHQFESQAAENGQKVDQEKKLPEATPPEEESEAKRARIAAKPTSPPPTGSQKLQPEASQPPECITIDDETTTTENADPEVGPSTSQPRKPAGKRKLIKEVITFGHLRIRDSQNREYFFSKKELLKIGINPSTITDDDLNELYEKAINDRLAASNPQVEVIDPPKPAPPPQTEKSSFPEVVVIEGFKMGDAVIVSDENKEFEATIRYKKVTATGNLFKVQYTHGRFEWVDESRIRAKPVIPEVLVPSEMVVAATSKVLNKRVPNDLPGPSKHVQRPVSSSSTTIDTSAITRGPPIPTKSTRKHAAVKLIQNQRAGPRLRKRLHSKATVTATETPAEEPVPKSAVKFNCIPCGKTVTQPAYSFLVIRIPACVDCAKRTIAVNDVRNLETALNGCNICNHCQQSGDTTT